MDFNTISYEEWIARLQKELKSEDLSPFHVEISNGQITDPFFQRNTSAEKGVRVEKNWEMKHVFQGGSVQNDQIIQALEGGINSVEIHNAQDIDNIAGLFSKVHLDFISLHLHYAGEQATEKVETFESYVNSLKNSEKFNISYYPSQNKNYNSVSENDIVKELTDVFNQIIQDIDHSSDLKGSAANIRITRFLSKDIVCEIAIKKAISLIWNNTLNGFNLDFIPLKTHATCQAEETKELESKYIALSSKGLTAVIAGYDSVYIAPASDEKATFHNRISRNIHHLLNMESFIQKSHEGFTGSYQLERIAKEITMSVWKNIKG